MAAVPREFPNPYLNQSHLNQTDHSGTKTELVKLARDLIIRLIQGCDESRSEDCSVYTGNSGIALFLSHLGAKNQADISPPDECRRKAEQMISTPTAPPRKRTFLCGDSGYFAVRAAVFHEVGNLDEADSMREKAIECAMKGLQSGAIADELLTGRAGCLHTLLFIRNRFGTTAVPQSYFDQGRQLIIESGQKLSKELKSQSPLMFKWHDKAYIGMAHGLAGILWILMKTPGFDGDEKCRKLVRDTLDYLQGLRFPSGNYPSSLGNSSDRLIHWCHGAPGLVHLFITAYQTFGDEAYLNEAIRCGEVVWERGILRKGYGICHGVAGNGYAFLHLWRLTKDSKQLFRAMKFGEWLLEWGKHGCPQPDRPLSLFEGLAGTLHFVTDLIDPSNAVFPTLF